MKKGIAIVCMAALLLILAGCGEPAPENIVFTGTIEEIYDGGILVSTSDEVGFDKASVRIPPEVEVDFDLLVGQTVRLTILPEIAESYPVQVTAVAIELVDQPAG